MSGGMDAAFAESVRELLAAVAAGGEPALPPGGGLTRILRETGSTNPRMAIGVLADRWFRAPPSTAVVGNDAEPLLNRPEIGESEKLHPTLREHVVGQRRWQQLSSNESSVFH